MKNTGLTTSTVAVPLEVSKEEWGKVADMVGRAEKQGAQVALGGGRDAGHEFARGHCFAPTVLTNEHGYQRYIQHKPLYLNYGTQS